VVESSWNREFALDDLAQLEGPIVEVFCSCPSRTAWERYADRAASPHPAHLDLDRLLEPRWDEDKAAAAGPLDGGWPVVSVDTTRPLDAVALANRIRDIWPTRWTG
jgi:hypothetical protein